MSLKPLSMLFVCVVVIGIATRSTQAAKTAERYCDLPIMQLVRSHPNAFNVYVRRSKRDNSEHLGMKAPPGPIFLHSANFRVGKGGHTHHTIRSFWDAMTGKVLIVQEKKLDFRMPAECRTAEFSFAFPGIRGIEDGRVSYRGGDSHVQMFGIRADGTFENGYSERVSFCDAKERLQDAIQRTGRSRALFTVADRLHEHDASDLFQSWVAKLNAAGKLPAYIIPMQGRPIITHWFDYGFECLAQYLDPVSKRTQIVHFNRARKKWNIGSLYPEGAIDLSFSSPERKASEIFVRTLSPSGAFSLEEAKGWLSVRGFGVYGLHTGFTLDDVGTIIAATTDFYDPPTGSRLIHRNVQYDKSNEDQDRRVALQPGDVVTTDLTRFPQLRRYVQTKLRTLRTGNRNGFRQAARAVAMDGNDVLHDRRVTRNYGETDSELPPRHLANLRVTLSSVFVGDPKVRAGFPDLTPEHVDIHESFSLPWEQIARFSVRGTGRMFGFRRVLEKSRSEAKWSNPETFELDPALARSFED